MNHYIKLKKVRKIAQQENVPVPGVNEGPARPHPPGKMNEYLVANGDGRVGEAAVPGHADLHGDRLREVVAHAVRHLHQHHGEADAQQEHPQQAPPQRAALVDRRPQS